MCRNHHKSGLKRQGTPNALVTPEIRYCWKDYDFSYLHNQSTAIQRCAALYEYARESDEFIAVVVDFRETYITASVLNIYPLHEASFLGNAHGFPELSFRKALELGLTCPPLKTNDVEVLSACEVVHSFGYLKQQDRDEAVKEFIDRLGQRNRIQYLVTIRWGGCPDAKLVDLAAKLLLKKRREETAWRIRAGRIKSERIRPGRRGMPQSASGIDYLHQLSVFRFQKSGGTYPNRPSYLRELYPGGENKTVPTKGWNKAFQAAANRIA